MHSKKYGHKPITETASTLVIVILSFLNRYKILKIEILQIKINLNREEVIL